MINKIYNSDCIEGLKTLPDNSIDCCVTSPPYFGLRDYGHDGQIGLEDTPDDFVAKMVEVFTEVKRVLKDDGTLWLNLGDSYASNKGGTTPPAQTVAGGINGKGGERERRGQKDGYNPLRDCTKFGLKGKDLIGIPWMVAFALRSAGWYLRQDIIWSKPNPMPESVADRCTKAHEYIFLLSRSQRYYFDAKAIAQPLALSSIPRLNQDIENQKGSDRVPGKSSPMKAVGGSKHKNLENKGQQTHTLHVTRNESGKEFVSEDGTANKRSVWTIPTKPFKEAHFATFPEELIVDCIKAGSPGGG